MDDSATKFPKVKHHLHMAKATDEELDALVDFMRQIRQLNAEDWFGQEFGDASTELIDKATFSEERIVMGYKVMVSNAYDPELTYLEFNSEIRIARQRAEDMQAAQTELERQWQEFYPAMTHHKLLDDSQQQMLENLNRVVRKMVAT